MTRLRDCFAAALLLTCAGTQGFGQFKTDLVNQQGATAPCVGIGPIGGPVAKKCVDLFQQAGFIRQDELGWSGLTIGTSGKDDGAILAIVMQSPAANAGLEVGDVITAVAGKPVKPTPGMIAARAVFGQRGVTLHLTVKRSGSELQASLVRAPQNAPQGPKISGMFTTVKPMINWQSQFAPCMGAGPAAMAAVEFCYKHFKPYGFIKAGELGSTGFQVDLAGERKAVVSTVEPDSPAARAGMAPGDEIVAVEGQPLTASTGEAANEKLFGKAGDRIQVTVRRGKAEKSVELTLVPKAKE
jgi:S1-C subfamily serine protease